MVRIERQKEASYRLGCVNQQVAASCFDEVALKAHMRGVLRVHTCGGWLGSGHVLTYWMWQPSCWMFSAKAAASKVDFIGHVCWRCY